MLEIERVSWWKARYAVRVDHGVGGMWERRRRTESISGELAGERYDMRRRGRKHFVLTHGGEVLAQAAAGKRGRWTISAGDSSFELRRRSSWRSEMELQRDGVTVGSIRKARAPRGKIQCELPSELTPPAQTFIGLLVLTLWNRAAASSGTGAVAVSS
jgi:hypothetical protein